MKSGKSLELLSRASPYEVAGKSVVYAKPLRDVRTDTVKSRLGLETTAVAIEALDELEAPLFDVLAMDEVHMLQPSKTAHTASKWLRQGKELIFSGLNTDHAGRLMPTVARLLELSPETLINKQAVCEKCAEPATHTQVLNPDGSVIDKSMPPEVPDDGQYKYEARCRLCFR
jgi:thymidine kinase